ncbi:MAG: inverse autotransporter beta domain-containing protein [Proteobacteria bacterium]|nr:inverse autotransporter beta domain-containing protein [Pseudomonadota bacterium]
MAEAKRTAFASVLSVGLAFVSLTASAQAPSGGPDLKSSDTSWSLWPKWGPFLDLGGQVGANRKLGQTDLFVPLRQDERSMLFGDFRFQFDDQNSWEGNFGAGFRKMLSDGWNAGIYGYYDHRRSPNANFFDQLTFGAELLGTNFDFRGNTYWPVGNTTQTVGGPSTAPATASIAGSSLMINMPATMQVYEYALRGFDAEAGVRIPITPAQSPYNLRFYAGGYRFDSWSGLAPVVAGPRLRLEFTDYEVRGLWNGTRVMLGGEWQTDQVRGSQFYGGFRIRIPLQAEARRSHFTLQERRMTDPIVRDVDIVAGTRSVAISPATTEAAVSADGKSITAISSATTAGSGLPTAVANAGANSLVVLQGTFNTTATTTLQTGQTVMGAGSLAVTTASGRSVTVSLPGATIASTGSIAVKMATNSTLSGMTITNTVTSNILSAGVQATGGVTGVTITSNTITAINNGGNTADGVTITGVGTNVRLTDNTITAVSKPGSSAIALQANQSTFLASGNTLSASGDTSYNANYTISALNNTITAGSTGNVAVQGSCRSLGGTTGKVYFTDGTSCP